MPDTMESEMNVEPSERSMGLNPRTDLVKKFLTKNLTNSSEEDCTKFSISSEFELETDEAFSTTKQLEAVSNYVSAVDNSSKTDPRNSFSVERKFFGVIVNIDDEVLEAKIEDDQGQIFDFDFEIGEIPPIQRSRVEVGTMLNVCTGRLLIGKTTRRGVKVYLAPNNGSADIKNHIVNDILERWNFT